MKNRRAGEALIGTFVLLVFVAGPASAATCNENCNTTSDCTTSSCPVCTGVCTSCYELGDQTLCLDADTGGNLYCEWDTIKCQPIGAIPEVGKGWIGWLFGALALFLTLGYGIRSQQVFRRAGKS